MDGNEEAEIEHLATLSEKFGHQLRTAKCEKMVATQLVPDESTGMVTAVLGPTLQAALHTKAGTSMNFPRGVLFGPALFQGYRLQHPCCIQEISHGTTLFQESVGNSKTDQLPRLTAECFRLEPVGIPFELGSTQGSKLV